MKYYHCLCIQWHKHILHLKEKRHLFCRETVCTNCRDADKKKGCLVSYSDLEARNIIGLENASSKCHIKSDSLKLRQNGLLITIFATILLAYMSTEKGRKDSKFNLPTIIISSQGLRTEINVIGLLHAEQLEVILFGILKQGKRLNTFPSHFF